MQQRLVTWFERTSFTPRKAFSTQTTQTFNKVIKRLPESRDVFMIPFRYLLLFFRIPILLTLINLKLQGINKCVSDFLCLSGDKS